MLQQFNSIWPELHRPKTIEQYRFQNEDHSNAFTQMLSARDIPHLLFTGGPGTGKTALAKLLIDACIDPEFRDTDVLKLNASDDNSVDNMRQRVLSFIESMSFGGIKIVWLEEADYLSQNAQGVLRDYMETYQSDCRFILSCNSLHKIVPAIRSRCEQYTFKAISRCHAEEIAATILIAEKIKFNLPTLIEHVNAAYPDMRAVINGLRSGSRTGTLLPPSSVAVNLDTFAEVVDSIVANSWSKLISFARSSIVDDEWDSVYEALYENLPNNPVAKKSSDTLDSAIITIAQYLHQHSTSVRPNINGVACLIQLKQIMGND